MTKLPQNPEAERAVIGACLLHRSAMSDVADLLSADDFHDPRHEAIFAAMSAIEKTGGVIDLITVAEQLRRDGRMARLAASGSEAYLAELANWTSAGSAVRAHAELVKEKSVVRKLILATSAITELGIRDELASEDLVDRAQQAVFDCAQRAHRNNYVPLASVLPETMRLIEDRSLMGGGLRGLSTGYDDLDKMVSGVQAGQLIIIAARPAMGKTSLALAMGQNIARSGQPALIFSMEMTREELAERLIASEGRISSAAMREARMSPAEWRSYNDAAQRLLALPLDIDDTGGLTVMEIRAKARRWKSDRRLFPAENGNIGVVIVDYLQLMSGSKGAGRDRTREGEIAEISRGLKALAKELRVPIIALSQLNRECEARTNKRPQLSDLRESGAIEQDADTVWFIYRDEVYHPETPARGTAELIIGKQRNGPTGTVVLTWSGDCTRFDNHSGRAAA